MQALLALDVYLSRFTATEEFDQLCFDYGLELDEDVLGSTYCANLMLTATC